MHAYVYWRACVCVCVRICEHVHVCARALCSLGLFCFATGCVVAVSGANKARLGPSPILTHLDPDHTDTCVHTHTHRERDVCLCTYIPTQPYTHTPVHSNPHTHPCTHAPFVAPNRAQYINPAVKSVVVKGLGEVISRGKGTRVFATMNPAVVGGNRTSLPRSVEALFLKVNTHAQCFICYIMYPFIVILCTR